MLETGAWIQENAIYIIGIASLLVAVALLLHVREGDSQEGTKKKVK